MVWDHNLSRAARFHSANLADIGRGLSHDSLCTVVSDINTRYDPGPCGGAAACGCEGGMGSCSGACTSWSARIARFGTSPSGENIARAGTDPVRVFYLWLHEPDSSPMCGFRIANGHRFNILGGNSRIGVGYDSSYWTQDFAGGGSPDGIISGVHHPKTGSSIEFRANWYDSAAPSMATVNVGGSCVPMTIERGSGTNGTYLGTSAVSGCTRYYFQFEGPSGTVTYPSTGSFGIGCPEDWTSARPGACGCTPSCGGATCGDDGCGGTCGTCPAGQPCVGGACVPPGVDAGPIPSDDSGVPPDMDGGPAGSDSGVPVTDGGSPGDSGGAPVDAGEPADTGPAVRSTEPAMAERQ